MTTLTLRTNNTEVIEFDGLADLTTSPITYINNATVTLRIQDRYGNDVNGETWPLTMSYVSGSNGKYQASISDDLILVAYKEYVGLIQITSGQGNAEIKKPLLVIPRTE